MSSREVIIVGSGPAGLTAAIYAARANLKPLVIEGIAAGGQLMLTTEVENFPGFQQGIMGPELMGELRAQAARFGAEFLTDNVSRVDFSERPFRVWVGDQEFSADSIIVSTGAHARMLDVPGESRLLGHGVSTCATCDGFFFRNQEIAVIGGGDSAIEEANFLSKFASKVYLIHRRDTLRASQIMQERALANPKIEFIWNTVVSGVEGDATVTGLELTDVATGATRTLAVTGMFVAIGHVPNSELFDGILDLDDQGYIKVLPGRSLTNIEGVFACGDVVDHTYRQAITAAGMGCMAAIDTERYLQSVQSP
ncbi:MAG: thioredoxin-disulfide reductase [Actinobacteria bacterium]|nr:thioredoxin-disulfide reductase [Actinomycetota bacterium]MCB9390037.1 thioredoxin-disulfide reductase [Acidimicrobiia bacterium]